MEIHAHSKSRRLLLGGLLVSLALGLAVGCQTTEPPNDVAVTDQPESIDEPEAAAVPVEDEEGAVEMDPPSTPEEGALTTEATGGEEATTAGEESDGSGISEAEGTTEEMIPSESVDPGTDESARSAVAEEEVVDDPSVGASLTILGVPRSARVRIMNIKQKYRRGMRLPPGTYDVIVDEPGYVTKTRTVKLGPKDIRIEVKLSREP